MRLRAFCALEEALFELAGELAGVFAGVGLRLIVKPKHKKEKGDDPRKSRRQSGGQGLDASYSVS